MIDVAMSYMYLGNYRADMTTLNSINNNIQLLDETEQNIVIYQWRADQLFADAEGRGK